MNTAMAIINKVIIMVLLNFFEPVNGFVKHPAQQEQGKK